MSGMHRHISTPMAEPNVGRHDNNRTFPDGTQTRTPITSTGRDSVVRGNGAEPCHDLASLTDVVKAFVHAGMFMTDGKTAGTTAAVVGASMQQTSVRGQES